MLDALVDPAGRIHQMAQMAIQLVKSEQIQENVDANPLTQGGPLPVVSRVP